jgi:hypothetical protein
MLSCELKTHGRDEKRKHILIGRPEQKMTIRRPSHRCEDNIKMNLKEIFSENINWIHLALDRTQWQPLVK